MYHYASDDADTSLNFFLMACLPVSGHLAILYGKQHGDNFSNIQNQEDKSLFIFLQHGQLGLYVSLSEWKSFTSQTFRRLSVLPCFLEVLGTVWNIIIKN